MLLQVPSKTLTTHIWGWFKGIGNLLFEKKWYAKSTEVNRCQQISTVLNRLQSVKNTPQIWTWGFMTFPLVPTPSR